MHTLCYIKANIYHRNSNSLKTSKSIYLLKDVRDYTTNILTLSLRTCNGVRFMLIKQFSSDLSTDTSSSDSDRCIISTRVARFLLNCSRSFLHYRFRVARRLPKLTPTIHSRFRLQLNHLRIYLGKLFTSSYFLTL